MVRDICLVSLIPKYLASIVYIFKVLDRCSSAVQSRKEPSSFPPCPMEPKLIRMAGTSPGCIFPQGPHCLGFIVWTVLSRGYECSSSAMEDSWFKLNIPACVGAIECQTKHRGRNF